MVALRCYDPASNGGGGGIHVWFGELHPRYRAQVLSVLELVSAEKDLRDFSEDEIKSLHGACDGLTEIIIDFLAGENEVTIRILGFEGPGRGEFTLLTGFQKFNDNSIYGFYCPQAQRRKEGVLRDGRRAPPCPF
jgi:hypothetical protein